MDLRTYLSGVDVRPKKERLCLAELQVLHCYECCSGPDVSNEGLEPHAVGGAARGGLGQVEGAGDIPALKEILGKIGHRESTTQ